VTGLVIALKFPCRDPGGDKKNPTGIPAGIQVSRTAALVLLLASQKWYLYYSETKSIANSVS